MDFHSDAFIEEKSGSRHLVCKLPNEASQSYRMAAACANRIPGMAQAGIKHVDGDAYAYYCIDNRISLSELVKGRPPDMTSIVAILTGICKTVCLGRHFLLNDDEYILDERHIFIYPDTMDTLLIYFPYGISRCSFPDAMRKLLIGFAIHADNDVMLLKSGVLQDLMRYIRSSGFNAGDFHSRLNTLACESINDSEPAAVDVYPKDSNKKSVHDIFRKTARNLREILGFIHKERSEDFIVTQPIFAETEILKVMTRRNRAVLKHIQGEGSDDIIINKPGFVIGRSADCDGVIRNNAIGRIHAKIVSEEDGFSIFDNNSVNGTFLNDARLESGKCFKLEIGDRIAFANCEYEFATIIQHGLKGETTGLS